ncbi:MAG TPA: phosphoribosylanthranilate isomerase [Acidobacteriaceae bacterium]|jgi:phosphoribosylanthranilate isomerase|nr:phosphoribosylanthranilate isomerase [Acidobacteriaceae bacterium]
MWVKICANTNLEDAAIAAELGADAVGFVFASSKRQVSIAQVAVMTAALPLGVERVGVFDSQSADEIAAAASQAGLTAVQLHRGYDESLLALLSEILSDRVEIIPTLHWNIDSGDSAIADRIASELERIAVAGRVRRVLVDSKVNGTSGGTGVPFDWNAARRVFAQGPETLNIILAGGLRPENIAEAIQELNPSGVDVASGVEASPGHKDPARIAAFIRNARSAGRRRPK